MLPYYLLLEKTIGIDVEEYESTDFLKSQIPYGKNSNRQKDRYRKIGWPKFKVNVFEDSLPNRIDGWIQNKKKNPICSTQSRERKSILIAGTRYIFPITWEEIDIMSLGYLKIWIMVLSLIVWLVFQSRVENNFATFYSPLYY